MNNEILRDVKPPVDDVSPLFKLPQNNLWWVALLLIALISLFVFYWYQRRKKSQIAAPVVAPAPWETAYNRLDELKAKNLIAQGKIKEYYIVLSDIARRYIEDRFKIKAPEMTTEEFFNSLRGARELSAQHKNILREFLNSCDMVKFAKYSSSADEADQGFELVKKLVDETRQ